ncbi:MAG: response regulator, partial [Solirubrobacteraceae bacterium]
MSGQLKVLIADDHPLIIAGIRRTIEHVEDMHVVGEAQSGAELVQLVERRRPDIVLMDLRMPGVTGTEMIELIRKRWPETRTVVLSACDDVPVIEAALQAGASAYVLKTAGSLDITSILRQAANGEVLPAPVTIPARPTAPDEPDTPSLTDRERDILSRVAAGLT